jgi:hypothetical protein
MTLQQQQDNYQTKKTNIEESINRDGVKVKRYRTFAWVLIWTGVAVVACTFYVFNNCKPNSILWQDWRDTFSSIGSFIGGTVTACWSLAGLMFVYIGFIGQKNQLALQQLEIEQNQLELRLNTEELKGQKKEAEQQNYILAIQRFENIFFSMLDLLRNVTDTYEFSDGNQHSVGRRAFVKLSQDIANYLQIPERVPSHQHYGMFVEAFRDKVDEGRFSFMQYIKVLLSILKLIETSPLLNEEEKVKYAQIVRSTLSDSEINFLLYFCCFNAEYHTLKALIVKYCMLFGYNPKLVQDKKILAYIDSQAFENNTPQYSSLTNPATPHTS